MAVSQRIIIRNPTVGTVLPKVVPKPINPFNTEQLDKFLSVIQNEPEWHDLFYMEVTTGLRRGEVCGLKWSDFDADSGSIKVSRTVTPAPHGLFKIGDTKTENGMRTIILVPSTLEMLKERQKKRGVAMDIPELFLPGTSDKSAFGIHEIQEHSEKVWSSRYSLPRSAPHIRNAGSIHGNQPEGAVRHPRTRGREFHARPVCSCDCRYAGKGVRDRRRDHDGYP